MITTSLSQMRYKQHQYLKKVVDNLLKITIIPSLWGIKATFGKCPKGSSFFSHYGFPYWSKVYKRQLGDQGIQAVPSAINRCQAVPSGTKRLVAIPQPAQGGVPALTHQTSPHRRAFVSSRPPSPHIYRVTFQK